MKLFLSISLLILSINGLWGQSNELLDRFLQAQKADAATTMLLVAQAAGQLPDAATPAQGFEWGLEQDFGKHLAKYSADDAMGLGLFYLALFKSFSISGGLMYNILPSPRYAANEAAYLGYIEPSSLYPNRSMPPYEVLTGISYIMDDLENGKLKVIG